MTGFHDDANQLTCDGLALGAIVSTVGTPVYVYSAATMRAAYRAMDAAFARVPHAIHYALKANSTLAVARLFQRLGAGADANSAGEIEVALRAGFDPSRIVFSGVGKTPEELDRAAGLGLKAVNIESPGEADRLARAAQTRGTTVRVAVRVNPDIDPRSHPHISTGAKSAKFGVPTEHARALCQAIARRPGLHLVGLHVHVGSQILDLTPLKRAAEALTSLAGQVRDDGVRLEHLDLGGGLGISYDGGEVPSPFDYAAALLPMVEEAGLSLILEPGRVLVGPAGALIGRVVDVKRYEGGKHFVVLDTGMTELLRPALYGAFHRIEPLARRPGDPQLAEIVGPLCETSDTLGKDRLVPPLDVGDCVAVLDAGAYGAAMASTYNRRPLPAEVMVDQGTWRVVRRRQTYDQMLAPEEQE